MTYEEMMQDIGTNEIKTVLLTDENSTLMSLTNIEEQTVVFLVYKKGRQWAEECSTLLKAMHVWNEAP